MRHKKIFLIGLVLIISILMIPFTKVFSQSNSEYSWYFVSRGKNTTPEAPKESASFLSETDSYFLGDTSKKEIFLTFDEGYENGNTEKILDILKETNVKSTFFVVKPYITSYPNLIKRMVDEGHIVGNHSSKHLSMPTLTNEAFNKEFKDVEDAYRDVTGKEIPKFFRPPMGKYSKDSLIKTKELGYKSIFWSFAYRDWLVDSQPSPEEGKKKILSSVHPGCIMLLHAVSDTNVKILKDVLTTLQNEGYTFKTLNDLP
ncbi:delta-lactam-biosynthetic de-N-acetylase [Clostridium thermobutyricum]|uniref:Delta-lactam-biosynthetic de-N-acetylase n=1 Tax=Clostridium thermobutyricum TaxID=29372 RepID=N9WGC7_9CLOT|nr:delta-lactam-biosynthetic de-N-acetylase [Clostridium thermobutyricum]ENZ01940.1 delta-lactam-biosynthetic de-N-acetylase [Clostridium thermobutyricum]